MKYIFPYIWYYPKVVTHAIVTVSLPLPHTYMHSHRCQADYIQVIDMDIDPAGVYSPKICGEYINDVVISTTGNYAVVRYRTDGVKVDRRTVGFEATFQSVGK